jgi:two-component system, LytTR family, sensor kinase
MDMINKVFTCNSCNKQFLLNEWRWKRVTIPIFIVITVFTVVDYPIDWKLFPFHFVNVSLLVALLWISNRSISVLYYTKYRQRKSVTAIILYRYLPSLVVSFLLVSGDILLFHEFVCTFFYEKKITDFIFEHKYIYLIIILFVYFINVSYEKLFLFIELTEAGILAEKYKRDSIEARFNNLKNKINPHFLFNTFNALSETIEEDPVKASKLVTEFSDVYRYVLENQEINWTPIKNELDFARSYTNLLKMRFEDKLVIDIDTKGLETDIFIAPLTFQILIENATKHNEISTRKNLKIEIYRHNDFIVVKNNLHEKKVINSGSSFGLKNLHERYKYLSGRDLEISKTDDEFIVNIPVITEISKIESGSTDQHLK